MSPELDDALCAKFPLIFVDRHGDPAMTAMCWGFEVGDGWFALVDVLSRELQRETDEQDAPQIVAEQVKSKGGSLRFHVGAASERQRAILDFAQAISRNICEACGTMSPANERQLAGSTIGCPACRRDQ